MKATERNSKKATSPHPEWALIHKRPGTELRLIKGKYYLYSYKTVYDKEKKGPKKISGGILGSITQEHGFVPSTKRELENTASSKVSKVILCKEYGIASLVMSLRFTPYCEALKNTFGEDWKNIIAIAYCRFIYRCPLKNIPFRLASSFLPEMLGIVPFSEKQASGILNRIGDQRQQMLQYMKSFIREGEYILMDATNVLSYSQHITLARKGYNNRLQYDPQFNLLYLYSANNRMPVYYRLLPGNIREVKAFKNSLMEAGLQNAIIVADKGFYSAANVTMLQKENLRFILPLKRDNALINYEPLAENTFKEGASYFNHEKRPVWYRKYQLEETLYLFLYLDETLRVKEDSDYLSRINTHPENYDIEKYHQKKNRFGTIALITELDHTAEEVYQTYKSRMSIEIMFDGMKNILEADHTYMQNEQTLQGWMFINHITLQWYQHLYIELKEKELIKQISVNDYINYLTDIKKIQINGSWYLNEFTAYTQKLLTKLNIKLT
jgi:hypothetical protein